MDAIVSTKTKTVPVQNLIRYISFKSALLNWLLSTHVWAIYADQHAPYTRFLPIPARKEANVPKLKSN